MVPLVKICRSPGGCPFLHKKEVLWNLQVWALTSFASRARTGHYGLNRAVQVQLVQVAIRAIGKTCEIKKGYNPNLSPPRQYIAPLEMQMEGFWRSDPILMPELAVQWRWQSGLGNRDGRQCA